MGTLGVVLSARSLEQRQYSWYPAVIAARATLTRQEKVMHPLTGNLVRSVPLSLKLGCISLRHRVLMRMKTMLW